MFHNKITPLLSVLHYSQFHNCMESKKKSYLFLCKSYLFLFGIEVLCVFEITTHFPPCYQVILAVQSSKILLYCSNTCSSLSTCPFARHRKEEGYSERTKTKEFTHCFS